MTLSPSLTVAYNLPMAASTGKAAGPLSVTSGHGRGDDEMDQKTDEDAACAEQFLAAIGCPRHIKPQTAHVLEYCFPELGTVDPSNPGVQHVMELLNDHRKTRINDDLSDVAYAQYLAMKAYSSCLLKCDVFPLGEHIRHYLARAADDRKAAAESEQKLPLAPRLRPAMWRSMVEWYMDYPYTARRSIGEYLIAVHRRHTREEGRIIRPELLMACIWNAGAEWILKDLGAYQRAQGPGWQDLCHAVRYARGNGRSVLRLLAENHYGETDVKWCVPLTGGADSENEELVVYAELYQVLDAVCENRINQSLVSVECAHPGSPG